MTTWLVDANVLLRFLTMDIPAQGQAARALLTRAASGQVLLRVTDLAFAEVVWVLEKVYRWPRADICTGLMPVLSLPGLSIDHGPAIGRALTDYASLNIDFIDACQAALAIEDGITEIVSYDRDFDRLPGVTRREP